MGGTVLIVGSVGVNSTSQLLPISSLRFCTPLVVAHVHCQVSMNSEKGGRFAIPVHHVCII